MTNFTYTQALSDIRTKARELGMTFKKQNATINNKQAYMLIDRNSGRVLSKNYTLWAAYEDTLNGHFDKVACDNGCKPQMYHRILDTVKNVANSSECCVERTEGFVRQVAVKLDKKGINVADSDHAHRILIEVLDDYFS